MAVENFAAGTLIIPMQEAFQNNGMWLAYGLVNRLLRNGIPVKWAIKPGKAYNGTDFTATTQDIQTLTPYVGQAYTGGPFIIDSSNAAAALPIITAWQASNPNVKVHRATAPFSAPIAATLNRRPRIAVEQTNSGIVTGYLNAAQIYDSNGNPWPSSSPDILSADEIGAGAFFGFNETDPCKQLVYDIFLSPHTSDGTWTDPVNAAQLDTFVKIGGMIHAMCHSISAIENFAGPFLTTAGFGAFANQGDAGSFTVDVPDYPSAQAVPTSNATQALPGGSEQTWLHTSVTYLPSTQVLAHFTRNNLQYDFMVGGSYKGGTGAGKVVYEGGHQYGTSLPYSNNFEGPYLRFFYDSIFFSIAKPRILLTTTPRNIPAGSTTTVTFALLNAGGSPANGLTASVTLDPSAVYNPGSASIPPTSIVGQTLTWNAAALAANTGPGTVLTFTAQVTPPASGIQSVATYTANFADGFNESYTMPSYCASVNATPGASPFVVKTPLNQTANPNSTVSWTITAGNNGTLALNNVVITDTLPAGLTFVSAVPAPTSVVPGPGGTTIITWQSPQIPASIPPLTPVGISITLNAIAPPATTATYTNNVNLAGTDTSPAQYSVDASATVNVVNRPPTVTVVSPNGGELVCQGTTIEWTAQDPDGDTLTYTLQYSSNGGSSWTTIATGLPGTCPPPGPPYCTYFWDTTALPSGSNYLVKVIASDGELTGEDVSNAPFTIDNTPPTVSWVSPLNGDFLNTTPVTLQATATDNVAVASVLFQYQANCTGPWTDIGTDTIPSGTTYSTNWELTDLPGGTYCLRAIATDTCGKTTATTIQVTADLPPTVQLTAPNGGEIVCPQGTTITWNASDPNGDALTYTLQYSSNGGSTWTQIASGLTGVCPCSYPWNTTGLPSGSNYLVKVIASDGISTAEDISNAPFTIDNTPPTVTWVTPTAGSLLSTSPVTLQATATDNVAVASVQFQYSTPTCSGPWTPIATVTVPSGGFYTTNWTTTGLSQGNYCLRAIATDTCGQTTATTVNVTVNFPPEVTVISPNGGEIICPQQGIDITWTALDPDGSPLTYTLLYSANGGSTYTQIVSGLTGTCFPAPCTYHWDTSALPSGSNYLVKVEASDGIATVADVSDAPFTIDNSPPVVVWLSPVSGSTLSTSPVTLRATATDNVSVASVVFQYSADNGVTWNVAGNGTLNAGAYTYDWNITSLPQGTYRLRAVAADQCNNTGESQAVTVTKNFPPAAKVIFPNGGETICPPQTTITWNATDPDGGTVTSSLLYSSDGGITYNLLATGLPGPCTPCSFTWNTLGLPSGSNYLIKVVVSDGLTTTTDVSDAPFTIDNTPPTLTFLTPTPGSYVHNTVTVSAEATDNVGVTGVTFAWSSDGINYVPIATVTTPLGNVYAASWNTLAVPEGPITLRATAADQCGNTTEEFIDVIVDNTPPTVAITSPPNNSTVDGTVPLVVEAHDNECLTKVELYIDGVLVDTIDAGGAMDTSFVYDWDTNLYSEGPHTVTAVATDCAGFTATTTNTYIVDNLPDHFTQVLVDGNLTIPSAKPDVEHIIDMTADPVVEKVSTFHTILGTKVTVRGYVEIGITYSAKDTEQTEHFAEFTVPFHAMILWPDLPLDACIEPVVIVEHKQWHLLNPRTVKKDIVLFVGIKEC